MDSSASSHSESEGLPPCSDHDGTTTPNEDLLSSSVAVKAKAKATTHTHPHDNIDNKSPEQPSHIEAPTTSSFTEHDPSPPPTPTSTHELFFFPPFQENPPTKTTWPLSSLPKYARRAIAAVCQGIRHVYNQSKTITRVWSRQSSMSAEFSKGKEAEEGLSSHVGIERDPPFWPKRWMDNSGEWKWSEEHSMFLREFMTR